MDFYHTIKDCECEVIISHSRFIAKAYHIKNEDEAIIYLNSLSKEYSDATHICYAYVADTAGFIARFSDNGEPSGTAGKPILDTITKNGLKQVLIAVIRYFGGTKLGAGGLTRAYGGSAADVIDRAEKLKYILSDVYTLESDFATAEKLKNFCTISGKIIKTEYSDYVNITVAVMTKTDFSTKACDIAGGRVKIEKIKTEYLIYD